MIWEISTTIETTIFSERYIKAIIRTLSERHNLQCQIEKVGGWIVRTFKFKVEGERDHILKFQEDMKVFIEELEKGD